MRLWQKAALVAAGVVTSIAALNWPRRQLQPGDIADRLVVDKGRRQLTLYRRGETLATYRVSLGRQPIGAKAREGDGRTPEGAYVIDYLKPDSSFHRALHVSYPSALDTSNAHAAGVSPGGLIMIHGIGNPLGWIGRAHRMLDWTDGCIAVTNDEIEEIFTAVPPGTPVDIRP